MSDKIRLVIQSDIEGLKKVVDSSRLFPSQYLDERITDYLQNEDTNDIWFAHIEGQTPIALGYCVPEKLTDGTYNLLALGVFNDYQRKGIARKMTKYIEELLLQKNGRILIVETSSDDAQVAARKFYHHIGYTQVAVIPDFWSDEEDKIVFCKKISQ